MILDLFEMVVFGASFTAILIAGATHLRVNLALYSVQTLFIGFATAMTAHAHADDMGIYGIACAITILKGLIVPVCLVMAIDKIRIQSDAASIIPAPLAMHLTIVFLGLSYLLVRGLPVPLEFSRGWPGATAAISLVFSGLVLMLTRRIAISQIVGFLIIENGIYLFALTQTHGMPMIVEMGVLLDVLVGVMISGLLVFKIQHSFEHIDVTRLTQLKD